MDDKEVRIDSGLGTSIHNDCNKRLPNGNVTYTSRDKSYPDSSHPLGKTDTRPCAIIGPDRVLPSTDSNDVYMKTIPIEPWEYPDNYRHPYESVKMTEYHQTHNISPRQTFQESMQHMMVPPTYSSIKSSDETSLKNPKLNVPAEGKYCDVPYSINMFSSEPKSVRSDSAMPAINPSFPRGVQPHGWPGGGVQPLKPYQAHEYYHNSEYSNCPAPRPMPIQQQRLVHDEIHPMYTDRLYQESNIRFKPYPTSKEKFPQPRYEYANTFQPPQNPMPRFDIQKSMHAHHYPMYPPYKYTVDRRFPEPLMETHPRAMYPQHNAFRTHPIHPAYGPSPGNYYHNKPYPSPSDNPKSLHANKLSYDTNNKIYLELENPRYKGYPSPDNYYYNDRAKLMRGDILMSGHTQMNSMGQQHLYKKDNLSIKGYDHPHHPYRDHRNLGNPLARTPLHFSPNTVSISPCDSNAGTEALMLGIPQEDFGYVNQSTTNVRNMDSNNSPADFYKRQGFNYSSINQTSSRRENNSKPASTTDNKKGLNLSQFFQMWNEGDEEVSPPNEVQTNSNYTSPKPQVNNNQEQLYILGSVPVSQEELSKYDHLQKVSKLPENIKGFNNIEILNQFEQLVELPGMTNLHVKNPPLKEYKVMPQTFSVNPTKDNTQRPVSPLDVEAKISQSVIHKEVGCNFEIKPCSPKVLNVDVATPVHDVIGERFIEKVSNPVLLNLGKDAESKIEVVDQSKKVTSCKMANSKFNQNSVNSAIVKPMYPLQDINANMGVCLASLPQLDSDIDLNLPEVNQQFIDANKVGTSCSPHQNVPLLDNTRPSLTKNNTLNPIHNEGPVTYHETDKETIKLSKYRKTKRADTLATTSIKSSNSVSSAQRTDSVIIKNPENIKVCNNSPHESLEMANTIRNKITPINKSTECYTTVVTTENIEKAIDFSVHKNEKTISTESEVNDATSNLTEKSQAYERNIHLSMRDSNKIKKSEKAPDSGLISKSFEQLNENFKNNADSSDFYNPRKETSQTNEKTFSKFLITKELVETEAKFCENQSEKCTSLNLDANETVKDHKASIEDDDNEIKNPTVSKSDNFSNLPDLSFDLAQISDEKSNKTHINDNPKEKENDLNSDVKDNIIDDGQSTYTDEASSYNKKKYNEISKLNIVVDTSKHVNPISLVDKIEKELEHMDTEFDATCNEISCKIPLTTSEANTNYLLQENLDDMTDSSSSITKSSDLSHDIENEESSIKSTTNEMQKCTTPTDFTVNENVIETHNDETLFTGILTNNNNVESLSGETNLECQKELLHGLLHNTDTKDVCYSIDEKICRLIEKDNAENSLESDTSNKIKCEEPNNINVREEITTSIDSNFKDCKSTVAETGRGQIKPAVIEIDDNNQDMICTSQNFDEITHKSHETVTSNVEIIYSAHNNQQIHRKALFSPWIQNLILYNTDTQILSYNKNDTEDNIFQHKKHLDERIVETINEVNILNHKEELDNATENIKDFAPKADVLQTVDESNSNASEDVKNTAENHKLSEISEISQNSKVFDTVRKTDTSCFGSSEFNELYPVRCFSPLPFGINKKPLKRTNKRSLSDSALKSDLHKDELSLITKRSKRNEKGLLQSSSMEANLSNIFRRNSISELYNDGNVVILIDKDLILTEERQETEICYTHEEEIPNNYDGDREIINSIAENLPEYEKEIWVDDVACTETVFSDDVAEDVVIGTPSSPKDFISSNYDMVNNESFMLCEEVIKNMENDVEVNELSTYHDSTYSIHTPYDYHDSNVDDIFTCLESPKDSGMFTDKMESNRRKAENILNHFEISTALFPNVIPTNDIMQDDKENVEVLNTLIEETEIVQNDRSHIQENSDCENYGEYSCTLSNCNSSSSPEVTSTTCDDKTPGIVLKISNHKRAKSSQLDDRKPGIKSKISYKLTEKKKYKPNFNSSGALITKAAQKYIPPIKITISDLKVKLPLPKNSLDKFKQLKTSKVEPKIEKKPVKTYSLSTSREVKKPKPKFEDVLMSIDKFQYSKPKAKNKKTRDQIPKVVIKRSESGAHYTSNSSSSSEDVQTPDLTGRKWQPWVFIEKNTFIDKMALKHKVKAIYCRRKKSYILAEKFRKYKSVYNAKFVISQPKSDDLNKGNLKYTIRLKHH